MKYWQLMVMGALFSSVVAASEVYQFDDPQQEQLFHQLSSELRCPTCQNNSLADSNAPLAEDLRRKTYTMVRDGKSKNEIVGYMKARYGHFISYEPPLTWSTAILWLGPLLFLFLGVMALWRMSKRRSILSTLDAGEQVRLAQLLQHDREDDA